MTSANNAANKLEADRGAEMLLRIARTADTLASERKYAERTFQDEVDLWLRAERLVLGKVA